jgi:hypothetical protein
MTVPAYALTDVWANPTQQFTALRMDAQDSGHAFGSLLLDLLINGASRFRFDPDNNQIIIQTTRFGPDPTGIGGGDILALRNGSRPQALVAYNSWTDTNNWDRGGMGWLLNPGAFTIGTFKAGSGTLYPVFFTGSNFYVGANDLAFNRAAPGVFELNNGTPGNDIGIYMTWGGTARVNSDISITSNATLANLAGMQVNVAAGRTYSFEVDIPFTCAAAGGIRAAIAGTCTATNIIYDGWIVDSAANGIKGNAQATALATVVANAPTTGTAGHVKISGTITVNAAGTLTVQGAQSVSNGTATVIKRGAKMIVDDIS